MPSRFTSFCTASAKSAEGLSFPSVTCWNSSQSARSMVTETRVVFGIAADSSMARSYAPSRYRMMAGR